MMTVGAATLGGPLLAACGSASAPVASATGSTELVALPRYVSALKVKPDLVGTADGIQDGFTSAITKYSTSVSGAIGSGGDVTALLISYLPPPPAVGQNTWWQAVNKRANINFKPDISPSGDYAAKFATTVAGNDIPDLVQLKLSENLPRVSDLLQSRFEDLSDYVAGDKILAYPNLAGIPTYSWKMARIKGRIYTVPVTRPVLFSPMFVRQDILDKIGAKQPTSSAEFEALCKELTSPKSGRWAIGSDSSGRFNTPYFGQVFGAPMRWKRNADGSLTKDWETDEFAAGVAFARKLRDAGYFHPDAGSITIAQTKDQFGAGKIAMYEDGPSGWKANYETYAPTASGFHCEAIVPFAHDGGKAIQFLDTGIFSLTALKKADKPRIEEMLRVLNFFAAPYGSEEYQLLNYGVKGVDYNINAQGLPISTDRGRVEQGVSFNYVMNGAQVLTDSAYPQYVHQAYAWEKKAVPLGLSDPTNGLYSETDSKSGSQLTKAFGDAILNIVSGRGSLKDLPVAISAWRSGGGDTIRKEYQQALAAGSTK